MSALSGPQRMAWDRAMRHKDALTLFCDGVAPSEADRVLGLEPGTTHRAVVFAWHNDLPMESKDWR